MIDIETIGVAVDSSGVTKGKRALDDFGRSADSASRKADSLSASNAKTAQNTEKLGNTSVVASRALGLLAGAMAAVAAVRGLTRQIDEYTKYTAQIKLATRSQEQYNQALADVRQIATRAQADITAVGTLYARLNTSLAHLNTSQRDIAKITETVNLGLKISGATAGESSSAILQLSQAFGSGVLRGEEFNAVNEAAPALMRALADSMGVPIGQLRNLASEGQITSEVLMQAFGDQALLDKYREQAKEVETISGALQVLKNTWLELVGSVKPLVIPLVLKVIEGTSNAMKWFEHFVFDKGELADLQYSMRAPAALEKLMRERELLVSGGNNLNPSNTANNRANRLKEVDAEINRLRGRIGLPEIVRGSSVPGAAGVTGGTVIGPNFSVPPVAQDIEEIHKRQAEQERIQKALADRAIAENKRIYDEQVEEIKKQFAFEDEMIEFRNKKEFEDQQKREKEMQAQRERHMQNQQRIADENFKNAQDEWKRQNEQMQREFERTSEIIERSLTDAIMRGFEKGKSFAENFRDVLKNMFKTLILQPVVKLLVDASGLAKLGGVISGAFGTNAVASGGSVAGGGFNGLLSQGKNLFQAVTNGFDSLNSSLISSIGDLGTFLSTGNGGLGDVLGGFIGQYSSQIASALPFAGAAFSLLTGDIKGAVSQGIGAGIGVAIGGPVGGLIGSALGSVVGGLFGGSGERFPQLSDARKGTYRNGVFRASQDDFVGDKMGGVGKSMDALMKTFSQQLGSLLSAFGRDDFIRTGATVRQRRTSGALATTFKAKFSGGAINFAREWGEDGEIESAFKEFAQRITGKYLVQAIRASDLPKEIIGLFSRGAVKQEILAPLIGSVIRLQGNADRLNEKFGITVRQSAAMTKELGIYGKEMTDYLNKLSAVTESTYSLGEQLVMARKKMESIYGRGLPSNLENFDKALKKINTSTKSGRAAFAELFNIREGFVQFKAAIDGLKGNVRGAIFSMVSDQEKLAMQREDMAKIFTELGYAIPGSIQELVALGKSIDFTTAEGLNLASVFPTLVQAFNAVGGAATELQDALNPNNFSTLTDFIRANAYRNNGIPMSMLPSYDVGTSYVPRTGPAIIHAGERILTASENRSFTQSSADLVAEVRALGAKVAELLRSSDDTAKNTRKTSDLLNSVTEGGRAMLTEAMA